MNTREAINKWNGGEDIKSVEMGGLGEGYENAIQQEIIPLCNNIQQSTRRYPFSCL